MKITVLGAAGGIGQSLALLLKTQLPAGSELALYDVSAVIAGIAVDLSHIPTDVTVKGYAAEEAVPALTGADIVLISAGVARKPGMDRADLFNINAGIIRKLVEQVAVAAPKACIGIITNPVNAMVPVAAEVLKRAGIYDKRKLFGITTLDVSRANTFVAAQLNRDPLTVNIPVIGGHSGLTILPLLSQVPNANFTEQDIIALTDHIQNAGTEVVNAKAGHGSATLSMANAAAWFTLSLVNGLEGKTNIVECAYVEGDGKYARFFAQPVLLGKEGVETLLPIGTLSKYEQTALDAMLETLRADIAQGEAFVNQ